MMEPLEPPAYRCCDCESDSAKPRNLVVFIDGTSHKPGEKNTNVVKVYNEVTKGNPGFPALEQRKYYVKGIGAYEVDRLPVHKRARRVVRSVFEQALAWNADQNVKNTYKWLVGEYRKGDQIYLFGFSRGAYQVRALASMIHEVGLAKKKEHTESAYDHYLAIDPYEPRTRNKATEFKQARCWERVRIHFVGVWDTVSSLGLIKRDVHVTVSASVTNACHFRHALALDERRVKFMPEYFLEMNAHQSIGSPRKAISDVKEVWFAGGHSDVGGTHRPVKVQNQMHASFKDDDPWLPTVHAGNVPFLWMREEAAAHGLVFESNEFTWDPEDIDFGTIETMTFGWKIAEIFPFRHQVSFSGTGKHKCRSHLFRPRPVIPGQQIHASTLSGDLYAPWATLAGGVCIPTTPLEALDKLWIDQPPDDRATTRMLTLLLRDQQTALKYLNNVLFLLHSKLSDGQIPPRLQWSEEDIRRRSDFDRFALSVIYDVTSNASEELMNAARAFLSTILPFPNHRDFSKTLGILRFLARHEGPRRRFIGYDEVIRSLVVALERTADSCTKHPFRALILALKRTAQNATESPFLLVVVSLRCLISDGDLRDRVIHQLSVISPIIQSSLSMALGARSSDRLLASLEIIASLAPFRPDLFQELKCKILKLAKGAGGAVGSAAVGALVALKALDAPFTHEIYFFNILAYLGDILPPLDVEVDSASDPDNIGNLSTVLLVNGSGRLNDAIMRKLVSTIKSRDAYERTAATLSLLKLCGHPIIQDFCSRHEVLGIFVRQLEQQNTCLLAAYALKTCLKHNMWTPDNFDCAARFIISMIERGWFDDAVGRVEGRDIFEGLMQSANLRQRVIDFGILAGLMQKLEDGTCHDVRMSLLCLDILGKHGPLDLEPIVQESLNRLKDVDEKVQKKGVKIFAALARTAAGEEAILPHVIDIVGMLPSLNGPSLPRPSSMASVFTVYDLCKNENLRESIRESREFNEFRDAFQNLLSQHMA